MSFIKKAGDNYTPNKIDRLIIASRPGSGKTSLLMQLPNTIFFDLEGSSGYFKGNCDIIDIKDRMIKEKVGMLTAIKNSIADIKSAGLIYKFVVVDTISKIDELAETVATVKYKNSVIGKDFKGDSVLELGFGAG